MPLDPPVCSGPVGAPTTSCLKRFVVHFRRPSPYKGEYGFDWLRDEYVYPIETVQVNHTWASPATLVNAPTPLCRNPTALRTEYKKDVIPDINPYNQPYYPAWLAIFPYGTPKGSTMHKKGVNLYLQLDEIDPIVDDGTEIILRPSDNCLKISPDKIPIADFIGSGKKTRNLGASLNVDYYELKSKLINIKCLNKTLTSHEEIKIIAKLGTIEKEVGKLMVYANDQIPDAKVITIDVITSYDTAGKPIYAKSHPSYEYLYKWQSFNQALIRTEVRADTVFDLVKLSSDPANTDVISFLNSYNPATNTCIPPTGSIYTSEGAYIRGTLKALYEKYGRFAPKNPTGASVGIDAAGHENSYLLFTTLAPDSGGLYGIAALDLTGPTAVWGNIYIVFQNALRDDHTIVHEAGHTFSLPHTFSTGLSPHVFHYGYTENFMDYTEKATTINSLGDPSNWVSNTYNGKMYSFFKWQWDLIRRDKSMDYT